MTTKIELTELDLKQLILKHIQTQMPDAQLTHADITIEVKSKQNYKSEWESAQFRATVSRYISL